MAPLRLTQTSTNGRHRLHIGIVLAATAHGIEPYADLGLWLWHQVWVES